MHVCEFSDRGLGILPVTVMYWCNANIACSLTGFELYLIGVEWYEVFFISLHLMPRTRVFDCYLHVPYMS